MKKIKENKGITLIALIITIIVLLILAVVAISAVQGDGIIAHAKNARDDYKDAQDTENTLLGNYMVQLNNANSEENSNEEEENGETLTEIYLEVDNESGNFIPTDENGTQLENVDLPDWVVSVDMGCAIYLGKSNSVTLTESTIAYDLNAGTMKIDLTSEHNDWNDYTIKIFNKNITSANFSNITLYQMVETFKDCTNLTSVTGLDGVTSIYDDSFKNCNNLKSLALNNVTSLGTTALANSGIETLTLKGSGVTFSDDAFTNCNSLNKIIINGSESNCDYLESLKSALTASGLTLSNITFQFSE